MAGSAHRLLMKYTDSANKPFFSELMSIIEKLVSKTKMQMDKVALFCAGSNREPARWYLSRSEGCNDDIPFHIL